VDKGLAGIGYSCIAREKHIREKELLASQGNEGINQPHLQISVTHISCQENAFIQATFFICYNISG